MSGHIPYRRSACLPDAEYHGGGRPHDASHGIRLPAEECLGIFLTDREHVFQTQSVTANGVRTTRATAYAIRTRSVRAYFLQTERMSSRHRVSQQRASGRYEPRHMTSRQGMLGHISYRRSASLPDAKCHGKGRPDNASHGIRLPDDECQRIFLLDGAHVFPM